MADGELCKNRHSLQTEGEKSHLQGGGKQKKKKEKPGSLQRAYKRSAGRAKNGKTQ